MLDFLGDIGGLTDALFIIFHLALKPFMKFYATSYVMTNLFKLKPAKKVKEGEIVEEQQSEQLNALKQAFYNMPRLKSMMYLVYCLRRGSK